MALKDWKKKQYESNVIFYENNKTKDVGLLKKGKGVYQVGFGVDYGGGISFRILRNFKTRSQALKFAEQYMRSH